MFVYMFEEDYYVVVTSGLKKSREEPGRSKSFIAVLVSYYFCREGPKNNSTKKLKHKDLPIQVQTETTDQESENSP